MIQGQTKGWRSSEFILNLLGMVGGVACALFSDSQWVAIAGPLLAAACGASYANARATTKRAIIGAQVLGDAEALSAAKKPSATPDS